MKHYVLKIIHETLLCVKDYRHGEVVKCKLHISNLM